MESKQREREREREERGERREERGERREERGERREKREERREKREERREKREEKRERVRVDPNEAGEADLDFSTAAVPPFAEALPGREARTWLLLLICGV